MTPLTVALYAFVPAVLMLSGFVKGTVGLGMPLIVVSLLGLVLDPRLVLALLVMPIVITNIWQAFNTGLPWQLLKRLWPLIIAFALGTWGGAHIIASINPDVLLAVLGMIVVVFSAITLLNPHWRLPAPWEIWMGPAVGMGSGILNGVSTVNGPPLAMYLVALDLNKDDFVAAYALIVLGGSIPLAASYASVGILGFEEFQWSLLALVPVLLGLWLGQHVRRYINPMLFKRILLYTLIVLGINLIRRGLF
ncbi:MAG: sulfite exporter TauE/SafE family protein [Aquisalimonadaceae bacterium]